MTARYSFLLKIGGALLLVALADFLFWDQGAGATLGLFALAWLVVVAGLRLEMLRRWPSRLALAASLLFALALAFDPGPLALLLFAAALTIAALLPRMAGFGDGWRWLVRLIAHGVLSAVGPVRDLLLLRKARRRRGGAGFLRGATMLIVPLLGSILFLALFAQANPLIQASLDRLAFWPNFDVLTIVHMIFWAIVFHGAWSVLRPSRLALPDIAIGGDPAVPMPGLSVASVTLSLLAFNLLFALQNGLDLAFLWSGAPLPDGMTLADYAHRGAYPLIATALLAGLFVLVAMRPGAATAASPPIRFLVVLWIAQNLLLVASTMLRTLDYVEAYSLTVLRIAALLWMGLVAVGLVLICYRLLRGKSGAWLINANLLAALLVLAGCTIADLGGIAAGWNVRHARDAGGSGAELDLCYLHQIGAPALVPIIELESRPLPRALRARLVWVRAMIHDRLARTQSDWHSWTPRGALRLATADALIAERGLPANRGTNRDCDGSIIPPPPPAPPAPPPLTGKGER